ncbi:MAG TPA: bifunctional pyr operon transcriptional regulator/uracil phosphoribosyltransferase PyrR [Actinobacteria bacterium]|nr:bifunctional pyr operon transcriptional regulator/uracil phosphoribosyltransferase PyrR [Actinomycetota bacterium]
MAFKEKTTIMDKDAIQRALTRIAHEIVERNGGAENLALVGIRSRGVHLASRLVRKIGEIEGVTPPLGALDITFYRDDIGTRPQPKASVTEIAFDVTGKDTILVDDVLYTGRSVRAAMDAIFDLGRPTTIQLAVMIDRGHRELPVRADFVGKNIPTSQREEVRVNLEEEDGIDAVILGEEVI